MTYTLVLELLATLSLITFIISLITIPWLIGKMPADYFIRHRQQVEERHRRHPVMTIIIFCFRNIIGVVLFISGIAMLVLPGQGIITIVIGLSLMDFPGKTKLIDAFLSKPKVIGVLNWIRRKEKKAPFMTDPEKSIEK